MRYAGFWRRVFANWLDVFILKLAATILILAGLYSKPAIVISVLLFILIQCLYPVVFHANWGQTIGKMAAGIKVLTSNGQPITMRHALLRSAIEIIFTILGTATFLMALGDISNVQYGTGDFGDKLKLISQVMPKNLWLGLAYASWYWSEVVTLLFNKKKRALHDLIAGTVVIVTR